MASLTNGSLANISTILNAIPYSGVVLGSWGIYESGTGDNAISRWLTDLKSLWTGKTFDYTSFLGFKFSMSADTVNTPIESGSFMTYNKTVNPVELTVTLSKEGYAYELEDFAKRIRNDAKTTKLFDIQTPTGAYKNYNIVGVDYSITEGHGTNLLVCDVRFKEVKEIETSIAGITKVSNEEDKPLDGWQILLYNTITDLVVGTIVTAVGDF